MAELDVKSLRNPRKDTSYWGVFQVETIWETFEAASMIDRVMTAINGPSLLEFMELQVHPYFQDEIVDRFAYEGDDKSGNWPELSETTQRIREAMGVEPDHPINERTGELLDYAMNSHWAYSGDDWAELDIPGDASSDALAAKFAHAQLGTTDNGLFPGAYTPPRPVLAYNAGDMESLLKLLEIHVMQQVAFGL